MPGCRSGACRKAEDRRPRRCRIIIKTLVSVGLVTQVTGCDHADLPRQLRCDAGPGRFPGRRMLRRERRNCGCQGCRKTAARLTFSDHYFDVSRIMGGEHDAQQKTIAIVGAGPVGLAAAAHVLERGMNPIVLEAGAEAGHAVRQWGHVQLFSPWEYNVDKAAGAAARADRLEFAGSAASIRPAAELIERYIEPLATTRRARARISRRRAASRRSAASASTR